MKQNLLRKSESYNENIHMSNGLGLISIVNCTDVMIQRAHQESRAVSKGCRFPGSQFTFYEENIWVFTIDTKKHFLFRLSSFAVWWYGYCEQKSVKTVVNFPGKNDTSITMKIYIDNASR